MVSVVAEPACVFCERLSDAAEQREQTIYEDALVHVSHALEDEGPTYLGSILVQTRRHTTDGLASLTDEEGRRLGLVVARLSRGLREVAGAAWAYTYCFTEGARHVHQFVVARYPDVPAESVRLGLLEWEGAPRGSAAEVGRLVRALRPWVHAEAPAKVR